jgi:uncharacterized protein with HEPN domain
MVERILSPRLADIVEAIERVRLILTGVSLEAFELDWEKRWLVERGIEILSEASRHLPTDLKTRRAHIPWSKVSGIGNVLRHEYDRVAPDVLWKLAQDDLTVLYDVCREELIAALAREEEDRE